MAGGVDQVEQIRLSVPGAIVERGGLGLDGNPALALERHGVEDLRLHLPVRQSAAELDEAVSQRRFAVVDVGDDGKVADKLHREVEKKGTHQCPSCFQKEAEFYRKSDCCAALCDAETGARIEVSWWRA